MGMSSSKRDNRQDRRPGWEMLRVISREMVVEDPEVDVTGENVEGDGGPAVSPATPPFRASPRSEPACCKTKCSC